jgi:hypothetical protein
MYYNLQKREFSKTEPSVFFIEYRKQEELSSFAYEIQTAAPW